MSLFKLNREGFGLWIIGVASLSLLAAVGAVIYSWSFLHNAAHADGRVIQNIERHENEPGSIAYPVFTFRDASGTEHTITSSEGSAPPSHHVGDAIRVLYEPNDPRNAKVDSFFSVWGLALIAGAIGLFYLPVGIIILRWPHIMSEFRKRDGKSIQTSKPPQRTGA